MWPFDRRPAVEAKSLAAPNEELLAILGAAGEGTAAVSASVALTVPAVAAAVRVISEAAATLPVTVKRRVGDQEADVPDHPALALLTRQANPWLSGFELVRDLVTQTLTSDAGGLAWVNKPSGQPAEIVHYETSVITVTYAESGEPTYRISDRIIPASEIIHVRGAFAKCPLTMAGEAVGVAHLMEKHVAKLFSSGARPSGAITFPVDSKIGEEAVGKIKAGWRAAFGGANKGGETAVLYHGGQFTPLSFSSVDSQTLELRKFQIDEVARAFRIPPSMIYSLDRMTWSNWESAGREFITYSLLPWLKALEAAFNRALLTDEERTEYRFCFDIDDTTQADLTARATAISTLISARVLNPNEARDWLGMAPRDGGEEYANPNTGSNQPGTVAPQPANENQPLQEAAA